VELRSKLPPSRSRHGQCLRPAFVITARTLTKIKVALVHGTASDEDALYREVEPLLSFNGDLATNQVGTFYFPTSIDYDPNATGVSTIAQAQQVDISAPDLVVTLGLWWQGNLGLNIGNRWSALNGAKPLPFYLNVYDSPEFTGDTSNDGRVFALDVNLSGALLQNDLAFRARLSQDQLTEPFGGSHLSDCVYSAFYGAYAASVAAGTSAASLDLSQFTQGMQAVTSGSTQGNLTQADISKLFGLIENKVPVQMVGAGAVLGFDPTTGVPSGGFALQCISASTSNGWTPAGLTFNATTGAADGTLACP